MWPFRRSLQKVLDGADHRRVFNDLFGRLPAKGEHTPLQQGVFDLWWLFAEVSNGTVEQYLLNSTGGAYGQTVEFLQRVGAGEAALVLRRVEQIFPKGIVPTDRSERMALLSKWADQQSEAEREAFIREISKDLLGFRAKVMQKTVEYVRANVEEYEPA